MKSIICHVYSDLVITHISSTWAMGTAAGVLVHGDRYGTFVGVIFGVDGCPHQSHGGFCGSEAPFMSE